MHKLVMVGLVAASMFAITGCGESEAEKAEKAKAEVNKQLDKIKDADGAAAKAAEAGKSALDSVLK